MEENQKIELPETQRKLELPGKAHKKLQHERHEQYEDISSLSPHKLSFTPRQSSRSDTYSDATSTERSIQELFKSIYKKSSPDEFPRLMKQLQKHIDSLFQDKKDMRAIFDASASKLNVLLEEKLEQITVLELEKNRILESAETSMLKLDSILSSRMDTIFVLEKKNNMLQDQLAQEREKNTQVSIGTARSSLTLSSRSHEQYTQEMADLENQLRSLEVTNDKLTMDNKDLEEALARESSLRRIAENYSSSNEEILNSHMLMIHNLELEVQDYKQQIIDLTKQISSLHHSSSKEGDKGVRLESELQELRLRSSDLNKTISSLNMQMEKEKFHNKTLAKTLQKAESELAEKTQFVDNIQTTINSHLKTISDLQLHTQDLILDGERQKIIYDTLEQNLAHLQSDFIKLQAENLQLKKQIKQLEIKSHDLQLAQACCNGLEKSLHDEKNNSKDMAAQVLRSMEAQVQLDVELRKTNEKLELLDEEYHLVWERYNQSITNITQLEQHNNDLGLTIQKLNSQLQIEKLKVVDKSRLEELQYMLKSEQEKIQSLIKLTEDLKKSWEIEKTQLLQANLKKELLWKMHIEEKMLLWIE